MEPEQQSEGAWSQASADELETIAHERHRLQDWQRLLELRERGADEREKIADRRERAADQREAEADRREREADRREAQADERVRIVADREAHVRTLEERMDSRARERGVPTATLQQRALEAIERSRELVAVSKAGLERSEGALERLKSRDERHDDQVDRRLAGAERAAQKTESHLIQSDVNTSIE